MYTSGAANDPRPGDWKGIARQKLRLEDFVAITVDSTTSPDDRSSIAGKIRHHTVPQTHTSNRLYLANFIGRFESIEEDFLFIKNKLGIDAVLPHMRKTTHLSYRQELPDAVINKLADFYSEDLDKLSYTL
jgi:hypothetical protein